MPKLTDWSWWVGHDQDGSCHTYTIAECETRQGAIQAGLRETRPGEAFHIIEARMWDRATEPPNPEHVPFARQRNHAVIVNGPTKSEGLP